MLNNFLCHKNTTLSFNPGITVFVGHNGSGKSSIIDSITFALFGEHTRKSNKNLSMKGGLNQTISEEGGSFVLMDFSVGATDYKIQRQINGSGQLVSAKLEQIVKSNGTVNGNVGNSGQKENFAVFRPIITGERKQLGESVINEVKTILGIDYPKLQIASIIHQGEISKIIDSQPKEFKELLNNMIGLDRLDRSFVSLYNILDEFRKLLREKTSGYDDNHISLLSNKLNDCKNKIDRSGTSLKKISLELSLKTEDMNKIEKDIDYLEPRVARIQEVKTLETSLTRYLKEKSTSLKTDIEKTKRMIFDIRESISTLKDKDEVLITIQMVQSEKDELNHALNRLEGEIGKLKGLTECAKKIQIKDGKCPVCNSQITKLNDMFDVSHIEAELRRKLKEKELTQQEITNITKEELLLAKKEKDIIASENMLSSYDYSRHQNIDTIEQKLFNLNRDYQTISKIEHFRFDGNENLNLLKVDDYSTNLINTISEMRKDVIDVNSNLLIQKKNLRNKLASEILDIQKQKAIFEKTMVDMEVEIKETEQILDELHAASNFIYDLEKIRSMVFNRDGIVSSSLRTWALSCISSKSSDYISTFNVGISRISLIEKPREIKVVCYGKRGEIDVMSLSGGEKVAVSLAIRMGIAYLMGSSKVDFIVLDEPTSNLDEERRRSFVKIISDVFSKGIGPLSQIIIITHDEEIFENSEIEQIYKFSMSDKGSVVQSI